MEITHHSAFPSMKIIHKESNTPIIRDSEAQHPSKCNIRMRVAPIGHPFSQGKKCSTHRECKYDPIHHHIMLILLYWVRKVYSPEKKKVQNVCVPNTFYVNVQALTK